MPIVLPTEIITSDKTPRVAVAFDRTSGVKQVPDTAKRVLLVGQQLSSGTQAAESPVKVFRETDGEKLFGRGSIMDVMIKAAFKAHPLAAITGVGVADNGAGTAAHASVTFATTATADSTYSFYFMGRRVDVSISKDDTATEIGDAFEAAFNAQKDFPATADNAAGVVTITCRHKGTVGNSMAIRDGGFAIACGTTATLSDDTLGSGATDPSFENALAAVAASRYHDIAIGLDSSAAGRDAQDHVEVNGDAEHGLGQIAIQTVTTGLVDSTDLATALNGVRNVVGALKATDSHYCEVVAALAAVMSSEEVATRPYNNLILRGIKPPKVEDRWTRTEIRNLIDNGVTPLQVLPGERVGIVRAVSTHTVNDASDPDYSVLDITIIQGFDFFRDAVKLMFETNYARARWADSDPDGLLPTDVATPEKVTQDLLDVARDMEALGICQQVEALASQIVVEKVGTQCHFSIPGDIVDGMHEKLGKIVLIRTPFGA